MKNILIFDSHPISVKGLQLILTRERDSFNVMEASSIDLFLEIMESQRVDIVFFGVNETYDFRFLKKKYFARTAWIACFSELGMNSALQLLNFGATGCIGKLCTVHEVLECINEVAADHNYICRHSADLWNKHFLQTQKKTKKVYMLSPRENEIATLLSTGMRTSEIALRLRIAISTVSTIKLNIFKKMEVGNVIQLNAILN